MDEDNNKNQNTAQITQTQQPKDAAPAATGEQAASGKTFTQDEVNRIVSDRLSRERAKFEQPPRNDRERELDARESALQCRELISGDNKYPKEFLEVLDTSDFEKFKKNADKLLTAFPGLSPSAPHFVPQFAGHTPGISRGSDDKIAQAFGLTERKG